MSSIIFNNFFKNMSQQDKINEIEKVYTGDSLQLFLTKYVNEQDEQAILTDWKRVYESSNYLQYLITAYVNYIKPVTRLKGFSKKLSKDELKRIKEFYKSNNWRSLFKQIAKSRKLYGDVYLYWYLREDGIPLLRYLHPKHMQIKIGKNQEPIAYIFEKTINWNKKIEGTTEYSQESISLKMVFRKGGVDTYENNVLVATELNKIEYIKEIPIIHFQFEKMENEPYSIIPSENLIDLCISLDRVETDISDINHYAGHPQQIITDGKVNMKHSKIGANSIEYVDTLQNSKHQAKITQLEITNSLESLYRERDEKLFMLFHKANLMPPEIVRILAKSDSSKVISQLEESLLDELKEFYNEISDKTKIIFKILMPKRNSEEVSLEIPTEILSMSPIDKAALIKSGVETLQNSLRENGKTEEEINQHLTEIVKQNIVFTTDAKNFQNVIKETNVYSETDITSVENIGTDDVTPIAENTVTLNMDNKLK